MAITRVKMLKAECDTEGCTFRTSAEWIYDLQGFGGTVSHASNSGDVVQDVPWWACSPGHIESSIHSAISKARE